jgi:hypothetical protein
LAAGCVLLSGCLQANRESTDYEKEMSRIDGDISKAGTDRAKDSADGNRYKLAKHLLTRASLSGDFQDYQAADVEITKDLSADSASPELFYLRASLDFKLHRIERAKSALNRLRPMAESPMSGLDANPMRALEGDVALHEGRYAEAESLYRVVLDGHQDWSDLCRLAYLDWKTGKAAAAESLYAKAKDGLSVKEMRSYAWIELQLGRMDFEFKRYDSSLAHYRQADLAYSGYWMTRQYQAESMAASGRTEEAIRLYKALIEKTGRPEFMSALAELLEPRVKTAAADYYQRADQAFDREFDLYPEAMLGNLTKHMLRRKGKQYDEKRVEVASRNYRNRPNGESELLLAQSYWASNQPAAAVKLMGELERTAWNSPEMSDFQKAIERKP